MSRLNANLFPPRLWVALVILLYRYDHRIEFYPNIIHRLSLLKEDLKLEKNLENLKISVSADVRDSLTQLLSAQEQLRLQRLNAELVQTNRDLVDKEYKAGQASLVRLNESQRELTSTQTRTALALVALRQSWWALMSETGMITEDKAFNYLNNND